MISRLFALIVSVLLLMASQSFAAGGFRLMDPVAAPDLALNALAGDKRNLNDYKGKVVLVNFWATWCPPCRREMPSMQRLKEKMSGRPFVILGVDSAEQREEVEDFLKMVKVDFPILLDPDSMATRRWKVFALPTSFLVDRNGKVRYSFSGPTEWDEGEAFQLIESLLREK
jgi:thiol-disulfide isomerase/thioredoxin